MQGSLLPGSLHTCSDLCCATHPKPVRESIMWKEQQNEQQQQKHGHNLNYLLWTSRGKDFVWHVTSPTVFCTADLLLPSAEGEHKQSIRTYTFPIKQAHRFIAQPSQHQQAWTRSFGSSLQSALALSYAAPMQLLGKTSPFTHCFLMGPFATCQQAGTHPIKAERNRVLALSEVHNMKKTTPPCHGASMFKCPRCSSSIMWDKGTRPLPETLTHLEVWIF